MFPYTLVIISTRGSAFVVTLRSRTLETMIDSVAAVVLVLFLVRLLVFARSRRNRGSGQLILDRPNTGGAYTVMVVLGSGGHTSEMLRLVRSLSAKKSRIRSLVMVVATSDTTSAARIGSILGADFPIPIQVRAIGRIRAVGESVVTAVMRMPSIMLSSITLIASVKPDVILTNGPGTCIPVIFASLLLQFLCVSARTVIVFVESFCRVKTVSLTGRVVYPVVDSFILQWPATAEIARKFPRSKYLGPLL